MKKIFILLLMLFGSFAAVSAQDAQAIIDRYNQVTGMDKLTPQEEASVYMDVSTVMQGMDIPMKMIVNPPDKMRVELSMMGMNMVVITDGRQGWIQIPGEGVEEIGPEMLAQFHSQANLKNNYRWDNEAFSFEYLGETQEGGKTYQKVRFIPKELTDQIDDMVAYFNKDTGLSDYLTMRISESGMSMDVRMDLSEVKTFGKYRIPSLYNITMEGTPLMVMRINDLKYGYPVDANTFAKPSE